MVGNLWSTQYMPPGVLCAFAGAETAGSAVSGSTSPAGFTHGVRFRCGDRKVCMCSPPVGWPQVRGVIPEHAGTQSSQPGWLHKQ